jgi:hypothetical protein
VWHSRTPRRRRRRVQASSTYEREREYRDVGAGAGGAAGHPAQRVRDPEGDPAVAVRWSSTVVWLQHACSRPRSTLSLSALRAVTTACRLPT